MSLEQFRWAMIPYGIPFSKRFRLHSAALFYNCKLLNPEIIIIINTKELGGEISE